MNYKKGDWVIISKDAVETHVPESCTGLQKLKEGCTPSIVFIDGFGVLSRYISSPTKLHLLLLGDADE